MKKKSDLLLSIICCGVGFLWLATVIGGCGSSKKPGSLCSGNQDCPTGQVCESGRCVVSLPTGDGEDSAPDITEDLKLPEDLQPDRGTEHQDTRADRSQEDIHAETSLPDTGQPDTGQTDNGQPDTAQPDIAGDVSDTVADTVEDVKPDLADLADAVEETVDDVGPDLADLALDSDLTDSFDVQQDTADLTDGSDLADTEDSDGSPEVLVCSPNVRSCNQNSLEVCNSQGTSLTVTTCPEGCNSQRLECNACTPDTSSCPDADTLATCKSDGSGSDTQNCAFGCDPVGLACFLCSDVRLSTLSGGNTHYCGIDRDDSSLWCWGRGDHGELAWSTGGEAHWARNTNKETWKQLSAGETHTCGIKSDDTLWCWGEFTNGRLGIGAVEPSDTSIPQQVGLDKWLMVAAGRWHTCALKLDKTLWCWGRNKEKQLGITGPTDEEFLPVEVEDAPTDKWIFIGTSAASWSNCAIREDQTMWCWGSNAQGMLATGDTSPRILPTRVNSFGTDKWKFVVTSLAFTCGIQSDDTLWCFGRNNEGQLGRGTITSSTTQLVLPDKVESQTVLPADQRCAPSAPTTWLKLDVGQRHACALRSDKTIWCWGSNDVTQLGHKKDGNNQDIIDLPCPIKLNDQQYETVFAAEFSTCALKADGSTYCWGNGSFGECGNGTGFGCDSPTLVQQQCVN